MLEIIRSPARVTWIIKLNNIPLEYCSTKREALSKVEEYKKYL